MHGYGTAMKDEQRRPWHAMAADDAVGELGSSMGRGLGSEEAAARLRVHGLNRVTASAGVPGWVRFLGQFNQVLVYVLIAAGAKAAWMGEWVDAGVILGVVVVNAVVGHIQEGKAQKAIGALSRMLVTMATVRRDGVRLQLNSEQLVPGDVVWIQSGDRVPADLRLVSVKGLRCDESALTGESMPSSKDVGLLDAGTVVGDRRNMAHAGTWVTQGQAEGVVVETGGRTETGRIASLIAGASDMETPLTRKLRGFSRLLVVVILAVAAVMFLVGWLRGRPADDMFMAAIALAVGAIPEGLPAAVTITLAIGVGRMARRKAIIRRLPAVETLGGTTVICSDKTGTLTENQMTVREAWADGESYGVTGDGYRLDGEVRHAGVACDVASNVALTETFRAGVLCNDSWLAVEAGGRVKVHGDPTEAALLVSGHKAGYVHAATHDATPRLDVIPFESDRMYMATLHASDPRVIYKKGALDRVLGRCDRMLGADGREVALDREGVRMAGERMASRGLRVLAFARRHVGDGHGELEHEHVKEGLTFLGLQGMMDPPRREAIDAVRRCHQAGIAVKMITGDHAGTAVAVAGQLGLRGAVGPDGRLEAINGEALERMDDARLPEVVEGTAVFARVAPEQKLRLVRALQSRGHVVAMTGDGVNDAPALKQADIGIAMGITGTEVAKGAASMVLLDDNFASIEAAVEEGRSVFDNLVKFIVWTLPTNVGEAMLMLVAVLAGLELPALPVHLLWINLATAILLGLTLVFEPQEAGLMQRPPRAPGQPLLTRALVLRTGLVALLMGAAGHGLFWWEQAVMGMTVAEARTVVVNVVVVVEVFYLLNCRSLTRPFFRLGWWSNPWITPGIVAMLGAQALFTYLPAMNRLFHTAPIRMDAWLHVAAVGVVVFVAVEAEKWIRYGGRRGENVAPE